MELDSGIRLLLLLGSVLTFFCVLIYMGTDIVPALKRKWTIPRLAAMRAEDALRLAGRKVFVAIDQKILDQAKNGKGNCEVPCPVNLLPLCKRHYESRGYTLEVVMQEKHRDNLVRISW